MQTHSMDLSSGLLAVTLLLVSPLVSAHASELQGRDLKIRSSDVVPVERRPSQGSAHAQVIHYYSSSMHAIKV